MTTFDSPPDVPWEDEPKKPTATLVITQGEGDKIDMALTFDPPTREGEEDPVAYKTMLIGLQAIMQAVNITPVEE